MTSSVSVKKANRQRLNRDQILLPNAIVFGILHLLPLLAFLTPVTTSAWIICISLYFIRMFFVTAGYHRYFSHRSFRTSRWFQFFLAFMAQTSMQKGVLWWAGNHRVHHRHSDHDEDPHSQTLFGFLYSHMGWLFIPNFKETRYKTMHDFSKYPELVWLNKNHLVPPLTLALVVFLLGGWLGYEGTLNSFLMHGAGAFLIGFMLSTIILYHGTYTINSLTHLFGKRRYKTKDNSRNNFFLALLTLGEGWHNNHHYFMASARQGFYWWEIDITYYGLKLLEKLGLIYQIIPVPEKVKNANRE